MSDHGFAPFKRERTFSTWLAEMDLPRLRIPREGCKRALPQCRLDQSKAYALGLNGLYINAAGGRSKGLYGA